jgi:hypothetical protein
MVNSRPMVSKRADRPASSRTCSSLRVEASAKSSSARVISVSLFTVSVSGEMARRFAPLDPSSNPTATKTIGMVV